MEKIEVTAPAGITIPVGALVSGLTDDQIRRRRRMLREVGEGVYRLVEATNFKIGETVEVEGTGSLGKTLFASVKRGDAPARAKTDVTERAREGMAPNASRAAIDKAIALGVDLGTVEGTGRGGSIKVGDVTKASKAAEAGEPESGNAADAGAGGPDEGAAAAGGAEGTLV